MATCAPIRHRGINVAAKEQPTYSGLAGTSFPFHAHCPGPGFGRIAVLGLSGAGAVAVQALAREGVESLTLVDTAEVDEDDLSAGWGLAPECRGRNRAVVWATELNEQYPGVEVLSYPERIEEGTLRPLITEADHVLIDDRIWSAGPASEIVADAAALRERLVLAQVGPASWVGEHLAGRILQALIDGAAPTVFVAAAAPARSPVSVRIPAVSGRAPADVVGAAR